MARHGKRLTVQTKTLDSFLSKYPPPAYLKIDVEGFEMNVLCGASKILKDIRPKIIIETHSSELKKEVIHFLDEYGYILKIEGRSAVGKGCMDSVQNLFFTGGQK